MDLFDESPDHRNTWYPGKPPTEVERLRAEVASLRARLAQLEKDASWKDNPDRMGGSFSDAEINSRGEYN